MIHMADSVTASEVIRLSKRMRLDAVAGYIDGKPEWRSFPALEAHFYGHAHCVSITTQGDDAALLDFERGDWPLRAGIPLAEAIKLAKQWIERQLSRGRWRPGVYANKDTWDSGLFSALAEYANRIRRVVADFDGIAVIPAGYDSKQYNDRGPNGENTDLYVCRDDFFPGTPKPAPKPPIPKPHPKVTAAAIAGALVTALQAFLHSHGINVLHLTPAETSAVTTCAAVLAGYLKSA